MSNKRISGVKIAIAALALTHLFCADDALIFCRANKEEAREVMQVLKVYGEAFGQIINAEKPRAFFSKNTDDRRRKEDLNILGGMKQVQ